MTFDDGIVKKAARRSRTLKISLGKGSVGPGSAVAGSAASKAS